MKSLKAFSLIKQALYAVEILNLLSNKFHLFKFHIGQLINMKHPRTKKCSICENRYAFKPLATSAFDPVEKRFVVLPCDTTGCPNHSCYACRFDNEDPWDPFNFELDKCTYCLHYQQRNKMCFNINMNKC